MRSFSSLALLSLASCAHALPARAPEPRTPVSQPAPSQVPTAASCTSSAPTSTPAERIAEHGSALDVYHRQDGVWLPHAPVLVNQDFDFALAMSMGDGLGAGLAAMKRKENNQKRADELRELRFDEAVNARLLELRCCGKDVYFVLWGADGVIKMVVDGEGDARVVEGQKAVGAAEIVRGAREMLHAAVFTNGCVTALVTR